MFFSIERACYLYVKLLASVDIMKLLHATETHRMTSSILRFIFFSINPAGELYVFERNISVTSPYNYKDLLYPRSLAKREPRT